MVPREPGIDAVKGAARAGRQGERTAEPLRNIRDNINARGSAVHSGHYDSVGRDF